MSKCNQLGVGHGKCKSVIALFNKMVSIEANYSLYSLEKKEGWRGAGHENGKDAQRIKLWINLWYNCFVDRVLLWLFLVFRGFRLWETVVQQLLGFRHYNENIIVECYVVYYYWLPNQGLRNGYNFCCKDTRKIGLQRNQLSSLSFGVNTFPGFHVCGRQNVAARN